MKFTHRFSPIAVLPIAFLLAGSHCPLHAQSVVLPPASGLAGEMPRAASSGDAPTGSALASETKDSAAATDAKPDKKTGEAKRQFGAPARPLGQKASTAAAPAPVYIAAGLPTPPPLNKKGYQFFGTIRLREEDWNWFPATKGNGAYSFLGGYVRAGVSRATRTEDVVLEFMAPFLAGLPGSAVAPAPEGALGLGGNYFAANHNRVMDFFLKNGYIRFKNVGNPANSLRLGRFEYSDGVETISPDSSLTWIKQNRIGQRLLGPFGFSNGGRSYDGVMAVNNTPKRNITAGFMMPTRGAFDLHGWDTLVDNRIGYLASTYPQPGPHASGEGRLFALYYEDVRDGAVVKVDNRPLTNAQGQPVRSADRSSISIGTFGGNYERVEPLGDGKIDGMFWGAAQIGRWGTLRQGAFAFAVEGGYQPKLPLKPWLRIGYNYFSGDGNNANGIHGTFFAPEPTPRNYARTPFFTEANLKDLFAQLILRPNPRLLLRGDVHSLRLADSHDLWYIGGGAYDVRNFGYTGRPSNGHSNLATLYDLSTDYQVSRNLTLSLYFGYADGGDVVKSIYRGTDLTFGYFEATFHF